MNTKTQSFLFLALLCGFLSVKAADAPARQPVIGIISAGGEDSEDEESYIDLSYVELVEAGGAIPIPIPWNLDDDRFDKLLNSVNGLMIINGEAALWKEDDDKRASRKTRREREPTEYQETLTYVVDFVIEKKSDGVHLPLWAIGQGFLATAIAITEDYTIVSSYYNDGVYKNLSLTPAAKKSVMFKGFSQSYMEVLENKTALYFEHEYAIGGSAAATLPAWKEDKWVITSYAQDDSEMGFAASMESQRYPIYTTMFQPDKTLYDANYNSRSTLPGGAIGAVKQMAKNFVAEAKKNENTMDNDLLNTLSFANVELTESDIYILNMNAFNQQWAPSFGFIKLIVLAFFIVGGYIGYKKYKQHQENKQFIEYQKQHEQNQPNGGTGAYKNVEMY